MRADLRRAHRRLWPVLALLLVAGFAAGLVLKPQRPVAPGAIAPGSAEPGSAEPGSAEPGAGVPKS